MACVFSYDNRHNVTEANFNYYAAPFVHPKRKMKEHDFIYMLSGKWKIGQDGEVFNLQQDSVLILNGGHTHYGVSPCSDGARTMYFHVSNESGDCILSDENTDIKNSFLCKSLTNAAEVPSIKMLFRETVNAKLAGNQRKADICFLHLLCEICENRNATSQSSIENKIKAIIQSHPERFYKNSELASLVNTSQKTAENKFKEQMGMSLHQYILQFKTEQAINYFRNFPNMSMKEIAYNLGFYDEYHFSRQFKKIVGVSPTEYKRKNI